jgi:3-deoxy-D-manno-octulosonic-acid transferase
MLKLVTHFFLQNQESADLLLSLKITNFSVTGDTRFDRVAHILENVKPIPLVEKFLNGQKAIIAGSSWKAEEALLMQYYRINPSHKLIIVPHEVNEENTKRICQLFDNNIVVYSKFNSTYSPDKKVMIVDQYGLLTSIYQYGFLALIGGGFGAGIHNVLEAATFGMPVIFGPNHQKFKEAIDMTELHCAFTVNNIEDFNPLLTHLLKNRTYWLNFRKKHRGT